MAIQPASPEWRVRPNATRTAIEIWLVGGCIDSIADLEEAEEFLRCMRPLISAKENAARTTQNDEHELPVANDKQVG